MLGGPGSCISHGQSNILSDQPQSRRRGFVCDCSVLQTQAYQGVLVCLPALLQGEKSERVLQLTADMINRNSADYTAWQHRWDTLTALKADMQQECVFTE
jgi:hypothetical protein